MGKRVDNITDILSGATGKDIDLNKLGTPVGPDIQLSDRILCYKVSYTRTDIGLACNTNYASISFVPTKERVVNRVESYLKDGKYYYPILKDVDINNIKYKALICYLVTDRDLIMENNSLFDTIEVAGKLK